LPSRGGMPLPALCWPLVSTNPFLNPPEPEYKTKRNRYMFQKASRAISFPPFAPSPRIRTQPKPAILSGNQARPPPVAIRPPRKLLAAKNNRPPNPRPFPAPSDLVPDLANLRSPASRLGDPPLNATAGKFFPEHAPSTTGGPARFPPAARRRSKRLPPRCQAPPTLLKRAIVPTYLRMRSGPWVNVTKSSGTPTPPPSPPPDKHYFRRRTRQKAPRQQPAPVRGRSLHRSKKYGPQETLPRNRDYRRLMTNSEHPTPTYNGGQPPEQRAPTTADLLPTTTYFRPRGMGERRASKKNIRTVFESEWVVHFFDFNHEVGSITAIQKQ